MSRVVLIALCLAVVGVVRADDDDDQILETPPVQAIPERMHDLEREWAEDVGIKDTDVEPPEPSPADEAHDAARGTSDEADLDAPAPPAPHVDAPAPTRKSSPSLESSLGGARPERPTARGVPTSPPAGGKEAQAAKRALRASTSSEE